MTGEGSGALRPCPPGPPESETPDFPQESRRRRAGCLAFSIPRDRR